MANLITSAGRTFQGSAVFETSGGTKCAIFTNTSSAILAYKNIDGTPTLMGVAQTGTLVFGGGSIYNVHAYIDSNDIVHVIAVHGETTNQTRDIAYNTISDPDGTPTWGTWEEIAQYDSTPVASPACAIVVDSGDIPHVLFINPDAYHGTPYMQIWYSNRSGGTWSAPENISDTPNFAYTFGTLTVKASDNLEAAFKGASGNDWTYKTRTSGTWGSESTYTGTDGRGNLAHSILVTTGGTVYRYWYDSGASQSLFENAVDTTYDLEVSWHEYSPSLFNDVDRYVLYLDTGADIHMIKNDGGGWTDEGDLQVGTYRGINASWQYLNHNVVDEIIYIFDTTGDSVYYDSYPLTERRIFITHF